MSRPDDLHQLEAELRDDLVALRERPGPAFRARLDERVAAGFPRRRRETPRWVRWTPPVAIAAAALVALIVALGSTKGDGGTSSSGSGRVLAAPQDAASGGSASRPRSVERSATLTLRVARGDVQRAADGVVRATQAVGGYVQRSDVSAGDRGDFVLRIPSRRLDDALAALSRLGHVGALQQSTQDITGSVSSAAARLQEARAERRGLLKALAAAGGGNEVTALKARLRDNRARIAAAERALRSARGRASLSTVSVSVVGVRRGATAPPAHEDPWSPGDALHAAGRVLEVGAGVALVALAVALLLAVPGLLGWLGLRAVRHRRREAAFDA